MRKLVLMSAVMVAMATSAHAVGGIDLSVGACPGNPGAIKDVVPIDCASGNSIVILGTWAPAEAITNLVALDGVLELYVAGGLDGAGFWDLAELPNRDEFGCNAGALSSNQARPATGCETPNTYKGCWDPIGSGTAVAAFYYPTDARGSIVRIAFTCYRPTLLSVSAGEKLFGFQLIIDGRNAVEVGGTCAGCDQAATLTWIEATPGANGPPNPTILSSPTGNFQGFGLQLSLDGSVPVPTVKRTWGQLKSLYR